MSRRDLFKIQVAEAMTKDPLSVPPSMTMSEVSGLA